MSIELSKTQVAVALAAALVSFVTVGQIMHQSRASTVATAPVADNNEQANATPALDTRSPDRKASARERRHQAMRDAQSRRDHARFGRDADARQASREHRPQRTARAQSVRRDPATDRQ